MEMEDHDQALTRFDVPEPFRILLVDDQRSLYV
jgi:hypothetical protein